MELTNLNLLTFVIFVLLVGVISFIFYRLYNKQIKFNKSFNLLASGKYFYVKYLFLLFSLFIILFASFGIKYGDKKINNESKGIDMMFVVDVSKSMNVADITDSKYAYTRLDIVKDSISRYVVNHREDRFGLIIFAGDAVSTIPLTSDHDLFLTLLKGVDYKNLTKQGSDFTKALSLGIERFNNSDDRSKALVFMSDGGDPDDQIDINSIENLTKNVKGITYLVVGVGTNKGGRIITGRDAFGRYVYQKYKGQYVISKINRNNLKEISSSLDGSYFEVEDVSDLKKLDNYTSELEKKVYKKSINGELGDFGRILTIMSFVSFILFIILYLFEDKFYKLIKKYYD